jgi:hypothetical protein
MSNGSTVVLAAKVPASSDPSVQSFQKFVHIDSSQYDRCRGAPTNPSCRSIPSRFRALESAELAELTSSTKALKLYKRSVRELSKGDLSSGTFVPRGPWKLSVDAFVQNLTVRFGKIGAGLEPLLIALLPLH